MHGSSELGIIVPRRSWREVFLWKRDTRLYEDFLFLLFFPSGDGSQRPAAVKGAPLFWRGAKRTLDGEDRCEPSAREEKTAKDAGVV